MPPKKWEEEEESSEEETSSDESVEVKPIVARKRFDDEEDSDDVADDWAEAEDSEVEREKAKKAAEAKAKADAVAAANKKTKSQRIEEHREATRLRRAAEDNESSEDEDDTERRVRLRKSEQDSDLKHAEDLFSGVGLGPKSRGIKPVVIEDKANPGQTIDLSSLSLFKPATKLQFEELSKVLVPLLTTQSSKPHYAIWVANFVKQLCSELPSSEIKKAASGLTALGNEKMKEEKSQDKGSKKSKAAKTKVSLAAGRDIGRGQADVTAYEDDGLGDDDFM